MPEYYDGTRLLSLLDLDNNKPEIYICTANRTGGKTTYFSRLLVNRFKKFKEKFMLLYRFNYELDDCADKFFKDIRELFFKNDVMTSKQKGRGIFHELYLNNEACGYAVSLNTADQVKRYSHFFSDTAAMMFDEFQSETNHYCADEVRKFQSIHKSVARGQGKMWRYVPVYMIANPVTLLNPYYTKMNISTRLNTETKFLKGHGFVLEQGFVQAASDAQKESGFAKAFADDDYEAYSSEGLYLNDNYAFIEKPEGKGTYIATIKYNGTLFGIREYAEKGIVYCDDRADVTFPLRISVTSEDHNVNYVMLNQYKFLIATLKLYFEKGSFRFKDLKSKEAILNMLSY